jgi:hypothetical protein
MTKQEADYYVIGESMSVRGRDSVLAILERWTDRETLDTHAHLAPPPFRPELRTVNTEREDYTSNRTR